MNRNEKRFVLRQNNRESELKPGAKGKYFYELRTDNIQIYLYVKTKVFCSQSQTHNHSIV